MDKKDQDHKKDQDNKKDQDSEDNEDTDEKEYMYKDMEKKESKDMSLVKTMVSLVKKGDMNMKERRAVAGGVGGVGVGGAHRVRQEAHAPRVARRAATRLALPLRALADETHRRPPVALLAKAR